MHAQTLDQDGDGSLFTHGRAWLFTDRSPNLEIEWRHGKAKCAAIVNFDADERAITFHLALPFLFSYYLVIRLLPAWLFPRRLFAFARDEGRFSGERRTTGVRIFDGGIWFSLWEDATEWRSSDPWWMRVTIRPIDLLFGRQRYASTTLSRVATVVPMIERTYPVTVDLTRDTWTRPRWPWWPITQTRERAKIDCPEGIPVPGKGENAWDCGEDAIYGLTTEASTADEAVVMMHRSVEKTRLRYGGPGWRPKARA